MHWYTWKCLLNTLERAVEQLAGCLAKETKLSSRGQSTIARNAGTCSLSPHEYLIRWRNATWIAVNLASPLSTSLVPRKWLKVTVSMQKRSHIFQEASYSWKSTGNKTLTYLKAIFTVHPVTYQEVCAKNFSPQSLLSLSEVLIQYLYICSTPPCTHTSLPASCIIILWRKIKAARQNLEQRAWERG